MTTMRAVGYRHSRPISEPDALEDLELPVPAPGPRDLLVDVRAVAVNPVDTKVRMRTDPGGEPKVLGWDAAGVVVGAGDEVSLFAPGDEVFYAGSVARAGCDSERHVVDERIVGRKPRSLSFPEAAALPLTSITAWECLFDRLRLDAGSTGALLVLGGAGGVGSILVQLARVLTGVTVIATASRPESQQWVRDLGAHHVVDHTADLVKQVGEIAPGGVDHVFTAYSTGREQDLAAVVRPQGQIVAIDDPEGFDVRVLKQKSIGFLWESMFTRPVFGTDDLVEQHRLLDRVADLVDAGTLRTTLTRTMSGLTAANLVEAHRLLEAHQVVGKIVVDLG
ncbi:MAG: zinc-binding alcohol dehydrogenase family protein [Nocardioidaceae bacterium]